MVGELCLSLIGRLVLEFKSLVMKMLKSSLEIAFNKKVNLKCWIEVVSKERGGGIVCGLVLEIKSLVMKMVKSSLEITFDGKVSLKCSIEVVSRERKRMV